MSSALVQLGRDFASALPNKAALFGSALKHTDEDATECSELVLDSLNLLEDATDTLSSGFIYALMCPF